MKTAVYIRVSTVGQNEAGQRSEIERWLTGNGIDPATVAWFIDRETGDNLDRPEVFPAARHEAESDLHPG
jgi:DNA invertase Pin-like site-specific DNA recombinase